MKKIILSIFVVALLLGGWWTAKLIWFKPLNIDHLFERVFIEFLLDDPELLTQLGIIDNSWLDFHSDELTDASIEGDMAVMAKMKNSLAVLNSYNFDQLSPSQQHSADVLAWFLNAQVQGEPYMYHNYPVNQLFGAQSELPTFMATSHQVVDLNSAENYIERLSQFKIKFGQILGGIKMREEKGIMPPRFVMERVLDEMNGFIDTPAGENILYTALQTSLDSINTISDDEKTNLLSNTEKIINETVYPAYKLLIDYFDGAKERTTDEDGVWKLPNGDEFYAYILKTHTTTEMPPQVVHELGLTEVGRIQAEMSIILDTLGYKGLSVGDAMMSLGADPEFQYPPTDSAREQILGDFQAIIDEIDQNLALYFDVRPQTGVQVKRIPEFKEETSAGAYYSPAALDGTRPGVFWVNLRAVEEIPKYSMRTLAYHEAIPGHHFQIAIQQELEDVPTFRKVLPFTAYTEGWALYAEQLAWEAGFEKNPYDNLGRLQAELFRAVRLVVDTGIHYKRWTRQEAIDYMIANTGMGTDDVTAEIERYIVMPGQACAYKIGMLKILELRQKAQDALGSRFDIREFHNVVLKNGSMPLDILERVVNQYISDVGAEENVPLPTSPASE